MSGTIQGVCLYVNMVCMCVCVRCMWDLYLGGEMAGQKKERGDTGNLKVVFKKFPQIDFVT